MITVSWYIFILLRIVVTKNDDFRRIRLLGIYDPIRIQTLPILYMLYTITKRISTYLNPMWTRSRYIYIYTYIHAHYAAYETYKTSDRRRLENECARRIIYNLTNEVFYIQGNRNLTNHWIFFVKIEIRKAEKCGFY